MGVVEFEFGGEMGSSGCGVEGGAHRDEVAVGHSAGSSGGKLDAIHNGAVRRRQVCESETLQRQCVDGRKWGLGVGGYMTGVEEDGVVPGHDGIFKQRVGGGGNEILLEVFGSAAEDDGVAMDERQRPSREGTFGFFVDEGDGDAV